MLREILKPEEVKRIERSFDLDKRAWELLNIINAEFQSDPKSVQCFDLRIVKEIKAICKERETNKPFGL